MNKKSSNCLCRHCRRRRWGLVASGMRGDPRGSATHRLPKLCVALTTAEEWTPDRGEVGGGEERGSGGREAGWGEGHIGVVVVVGWGLKVH